MIKVRNFQFFKMQTLSGRRLIFLTFLLFTFYFLLSAPILAQTDEPKDAEPPPIKIISKEEKNLLEAETDLKRRTDLSLRLIETRLKKAEDFNTEQAFEAMFTELGGFHALIDNTLNFLNRNDNGSKKVLNNYKKLEISLRAFLSRLEIIRRDLPLKYEFYVRGLVKVVRDARTRAVDSFFSDTVVPGKNNMLSEN